jgi:pimeloyl-ACP methyl ester carboxylesterase
MEGRRTPAAGWRGLIRKITTALALPALLAAQPAPAGVEAVGASTAELLQPHLVDIGGRRLNLVCVGEGSPTVVFDLPVFGHLLQWRKVMGPVSRISRACFFDRAGYDYSDPSPRPMTLANEADDLHRLLKAARIESPVVLVGHSLGGYYASMFADLYPDQVAGLVLIDPSYAGAGLPAVTPEQKTAEQKDEDDSEADMKRCADLARAGRLSAADPQGCFHLPPGWPTDETAFLTWSDTRPYKYEAYASEFRNDFSLEHGRDENSQEETRAARSWGDKPVIVMTSGKNFERADRRAERDAEWKAGHDRLAARSTQGVSLMFPDSGHYIQFDQPDAVVSAIETVVRKVRQGRPAG